MSSSMLRSTESSSPASVAFPSSEVRPGFSAVIHASGKLSRLDPGAEPVHRRARAVLTFEYPASEALEGCQFFGIRHPAAGPALHFLETVCEMPRDRIAVAAAGAFLFVVTAGRVVHQQSHPSFPQAGAHLRQSSRQVLSST